MLLLELWRAQAYNQNANKGQLQNLWSKYFVKEKEIYKQLLANPDEEVKGTVAELATKYKTDLSFMTGFLDGINDSLKVPNPLIFTKPSSRSPFSMVSTIACTKLSASSLLTPFLATNSSAIVVNVIFPISRLLILH